MPLTVQFGPWAPDQDDTPIQIPDTSGPLPVPCADVLNVIYVNGNYRSIASPSVASIDGNNIAPLNAQPVNAFSYFEPVGQQETVFVGTGTGVQMLNPDGSWSNVTLTTTQITALIGQAMKLGFGHFLNTNTLRGSSISFKSGALQATPSGVVFVAGGGGGTTTEIGFSTGSGGVFGSLVSGVTPVGALTAIYDFFFATGTAFLAVSAPSDPGRNGFTSVTANGTIFMSAEASYSYNVSKKTAEWIWGGKFGFATGSTYTVVFA